MVNNLETIELSPQTDAAIDSPLLQRYSVLDHDKNAKKSIEDLLTLSLDELLSRATEGQPPNKRLTEILLKILRYTRYTKVSSCLSM